MYYQCGFKRKTLMAKCNQIAKSSYKNPIQIQGKMSVEAEEKLSITQKEAVVTF